MKQSIKQSLPIEPDKFTEFEVQATIWTALRQMGFNARGEIKTRFVCERKRSCCRFDILVYKQDGDVLCIIEIKSDKRKDLSNWSETRQGKRYAEFGVPVYLIHGMSHSLKFLANLPFENV